MRSLVTCHNMKVQGLISTFTKRGSTYRPKVERGIIEIYLSNQWDEISRLFNSIPLGACWASHNVAAWFVN